MSSVNYNLKNKGVRLISAKTAWVKGKNGKLHLNSKRRLCIGKGYCIEVSRCEKKQIKRAERLFFIGFYLVLFLVFAFFYSLFII